VCTAEAQGIGYTASFYVSQTTYPDATGRDTTVYLFNGVDVTTGPVRSSISVPLVHRRTTLTGASLDGAPLESVDSRTRFADPLVRVDVRVLDDRARGVQLAVAGAVKLPTTPVESGLGTGETDVGVGGSLFTTRGKTSAFADLVFWRYGDPADIDYRNSLSYSVGVGRIIAAGRWSAMASLGGFSQGIAGGTGPVQLTLAMLALTGSHQSVAITAGIGLNDASQGFSIGTSWRIARNHR
jgi:hypothetical protein